MMKQKGASPIIPILIVAVLAIGVLVFFTQKNTGEMANNQPGPISAEVVTPQPAPSQGASIASSDPDAVVDDILKAATEEGSISDPTADATLIGNDTDAINSYIDAYDATNF